MIHSVVYRNEDSYCGPISMLLRPGDGSLLVVFREAKWRGVTTHIDPTTRMSSLRSFDGGLTWRSPVTVDNAGGNGCAATVLSDGSILANAFHWITVPIEERRRLSRYAEVRDVERLGVAAAAGGVFFTRSRTDGYTWSPARRFEEPEGWSWIACHAPAVELDEGELLLPVTVESRTAAVLRSEDAGATWHSPALITDDAEPDIRFHETRLIVLPDRRILAMHRTPDRNYYQNISDDGGHTWGATEDSGVWSGGSSPPDLKLLSDGRLLLTRGYRRAPYGIRAYLSDDHGAHWDTDSPIVLRDDGPDRDVGYPTTLELDDGELLTVYYWHDRDEVRHLAATRWRIDE